MSGFWLPKANRILMIAELSDGAVFGVELMGSPQFNLDLWPGEQETYLGMGEWTVQGPRRADVSASGLFRGQYVTDPAAWMAQQGRISPNQVDTAVHGPLSLDRGGNG